jgi:Tfp pilus assembly protein PilE
MVIILVFTVAAAVCTQIFAGSYNMSTQSKAQAMSVVYAQAAAEKFKAGDDTESVTSFDSEWAEVKAGSESARYSVVLVDVQASGHLKTASVNVYDADGEKGESIYSLQVKVFVN